ncbi:hypothetical protein G6F37_011290 [Rhizopus arrhizus]|nr:hypothetical protein G6F38_011353 [Rhizopus arrhizus]KAG1150052.1 hypothetical protein G6F37_011290 [Rhizopus arrhizus]
MYSFPTEYKLINNNNTLFKPSYYLPPINNSITHQAFYSKQWNHVSQNNQDQAPKHIVSPEAILEAQKEEAEEPNKPFSNFSTLFALKQRLSANQDHSTNKEELSNKVLLNEFLLFSSLTGRTQLQDNLNVTENEINQHIGKSWKASASNQKQYCALKKENYLKKHVDDDEQKERQNEEEQDNEYSKQALAITANVKAENISTTKKRLRKSNLSEGQKDPRGRKKKRQNHPFAPKHPMSAYLHYLIDVYPKVSQNFPGSTVGPISKSISAKWHAMSVEERLPWKQKAELDKARYAKELKIYMTNKKETDILNNEYINFMSNSSLENKITSLSKKLSYVLRHGALKENLDISSDGFVLLDDLLKLPRFKGVTYPDIQLVVDNNDKKRFELIQKEEDDQFYIRATQGHSLNVVQTDELLEKLDKVTTDVIHGTTLKAWETIKNEGLSKMNRIHIHFAIGLPNDPKVKSGVRKSSEVFIYIDAEKAMQDGIEFYKSRNDVILSDGINDTMYQIPIRNIEQDKVILLSDVQSLLPKATALLSNSKLVPFQLDSNLQELIPKRILISNSTIDNVWEAHVPEEYQNTLIQTTIEMQIKMDQLSEKVDKLLLLNNQDNTSNITATTTTTTTEGEEEEHSQTIITDVQNADADIEDDDDDEEEEEEYVEEHNDNPTTEDEVVHLLHMKHLYSAV